MKNVDYIDLDYKMSLTGILRFYLQVIKIVRGKKIDCGFCYNIICFPLMIFICKLSRIPLVFDYMELPVNTILEFVRKRFHFLPIKNIKNSLEVLLNRLIGLADGIIVVDTLKNSLYARLRKIQNNTELVSNYPSKHHFVSLERVEEFKNMFKDRKVLAYAGSIFGSKGLYHYFDLIELLIKDYPNILLLLVGKIVHEKREKIDDYLSRKNIDDHVMFIEQMPYEDLLALLSACHVGLALLDPQDSKFKEIGVGGSRKTYTYMQAGLPVIASLPQMKNFLEENEIGVFVEYSDNNMILQTMREMLLNKQLVYKISIKAKKLIEMKYNWENEEWKVEKVFHKAIQT